MKLVEFLQGKWLGHSLHSALVHIPVGAWISACFLDIAAGFGVGGFVLSRLALVCVSIGLLLALVAVPTGLAEWRAIKREKPAWKIALVHLLLNVAAVAGWVINLWLRVDSWRDGFSISKGVLFTSIAATLLLVVSGYLGSLMVFDHGIGVARHSKKYWRGIATRGGARLPEEK